MTPIEAIKERVKWDSKKSFDELYKEDREANPTHDEVVVMLYVGARNAGRSEKHSQLLPIIEGLLAVVEMQQEALRRYTGRKLEFNEDGGGTLLYNGNEGPKMPFFQGETWEYGSHAEEISELVQATLEKIGKGE